MVDFSRWLQTWFHGGLLLPSIANCHTTFLRIVTYDYHMSLNVAVVKQCCKPVLQQVFSYDSQVL